MEPVAAEGLEYLRSVSAEDVAAQRLPGGGPERHTEHAVPGRDRLIRERFADSRDIVAATMSGRFAVLHRLRRYQLLGGVGQHARSRLIDLELATLRAQPDWPVLRHTLIAWCESGFNLVAAAARLHVHRNTLVYRLTEIEQLGSCDPRDYPVCITTYLACLADRLNDT